MDENVVITDICVLFNALISAGTVITVLSVLSYHAVEISQPFLADKIFDPCNIYFVMRHLRYPLTLSPHNIEHENSSRHLP